MSFPSNEPKPAPNCAIGPSRPPEPPVPMVTALAISLTIGTRSRILQIVVVRRDGRVGAMSLGLGSKPEYDQAANQTAGGSDER